jgi:hypothetical protein
VPLNVVRQPWNACQYSQKLQLLSLFFSSTSLFLSLVLSTRMLELLLFSQQECFNLPVLGISPRTSWHLLLGNNTLRTSKLGLNLHVDHDPKEITFNLSPQNSKPLFHIQAWKRPTNLFTEVWYRSSIALLSVFLCCSFQRQSCNQDKTLRMHAIFLLEG